MGDINTFKVNDDGSVTVSAQSYEQEQNIIEILRIEKSKGGVFASRRMKKRAISYAKSVNFPDFKVDKLMLDKYPEDFASYPKTTSLILWLIIGITFLCGAVAFAFPTYFEYDYAVMYNDRIDACEEYLRTGNVEKYCRSVGRYMGSGSNYSIPKEDVEQDMNQMKDHRIYNLKEMMCYLLAVFGCLAISYISMRQYRRISKQINPRLNNKTNNISLQ